MSEKANPLVDELNKVLTCILDFKQVLTDFSKSASHDATRNKLKELVESREQESESIMGIIKDLGGQVETNERITDQEAVNWVPRPLPDSDNVSSLLDTLIKAEGNAIEAYEKLLKREKMDEGHRETLSKYKMAAEANLKYFESAQSSQ